MLNQVYLGLGSNLGDRVDNISRGLKLLRQISVNIIASSFYETTPQGFRDQPLFMNAACRMWTRLDCFQLMDRVKAIEAEVGRQRVFVNAPRTLDIDIIVFGQTVLETPNLTIPHPRMAERAFVLEPLAEIAPSLLHPALKETIRTLLMRLNVPKSRVRLRAQLGEDLPG